MGPPGARLLLGGNREAEGGRGHEDVAGRV